MIAEFARSVSTVIFMIGALIFGGLLPSEPDGTAVEVFAPSEDFTLYGEWEAFGEVYRFTSRRLEVGGESYVYRLGDGQLELSRDGIDRILPLEPIDDRTMKLNGIILRRVK